VYSPLWSFESLFFCIFTTNPFFSKTSRPQYSPPTPSPHLPPPFFCLRREGQSFFSPRLQEVGLLFPPLSNPHWELKREGCAPLPFFEMNNPQSTHPENTSPHPQKATPVFIFLNVFHRFTFSSSEKWPPAEKLKSSGIFLSHMFVFPPSS